MERGLTVYVGSHIVNGRESIPASGMELDAVNAAFFGERGRGGALKIVAMSDAEPEPFATMLTKTRTRMRHFSTASSRP